MFMVVLPGFLLFVSLAAFGIVVVALLAFWSLVVRRAGGWWHSAGGAEVRCMCHGVTGLVDVLGSRGELGACIGLFWCFLIFGGFLVCIFFRAGG